MLSGSLVEVNMCITLGIFRNRKIDEGSGICYLWSILVIPPSEDSGFATFKISIVSYFYFIIKYSIIKFLFLLLFYNQKDLLSIQVNKNN